MRQWPRRIAPVSVRSRKLSGRMIRVLLGSRTGVVTDEAIRSGYRTNWGRKRGA